MAARIASHPRHVALGALACGFVLAGRVEVAVLVGAALGATWAALARRAAGAGLALVVLVPAGAVVGGARLAEIDDASLVRAAGLHAEVAGYVVRRERPSFGVRRVRLEVTAFRTARGRGWVRLEERVQVRSRGPVLAGVAIGDELHVGGRLARPRAGRGRFDYAAHLRRGGVRTVMHADRIAVSGRRRGGLTGGLDQVRRRAEEGLAVGLPPTMGALARGMVLGADEDIPDATSEDFKASGLAHVLAVSGQNVALLVALAWPLLAAAGLRRRGRLAGAALLIAVYVPVTGAGPSVLRAGVMGLAAVAAAFAGRPASRWYALLVAATLTLGLDPRAWQDVGWQLSFAAVVGIFALARPLTGALSRLPEPLPAGAAMTIAATLATAPLMAFHFEGVSLAALPANLVALPAIPLVMWTGMLSAAVAQAWLAPAELLNALNGVFLAYVAAVAHWGARLPGAVASLRIATPVDLVLAYAVVAAGIALAWSARQRLYAWRAPLGAAVLLGVACAALLVPGARPMPPRQFTVTFLDVGQGDATLIQAPGGFAALVDGGPPQAGVARLLAARGVSRLALVVLTHAQEDHQGGLEEVLRRFPVQVLLDGGHPADGARHRRIVELARARGVRVVTAAAGQRFDLAGGLRIDVLAPRSAREPPHGLDPNLRAVVLHVAYRGLDVLLPADSESEVTAALALPAVEVLKVAHHGSEDEGLGGLLERLRPRAAVVPVGAENPFGHPHPATMRALRAGVPRVYRTDRHGDVELTLGPQGPRITAER